MSDELVEEGRGEQVERAAREGGDKRCGSAEGVEGGSLPEMVELVLEAI